MCTTCKLNNIWMGQNQTECKINWCVEVTSATPFSIFNWENGDLVETQFLRRRLAFTNSNGSVIDTSFHLILYVHNIYYIYQHCLHYGKPTVNRLNNTSMHHQIKSTGLEEHRKYRTSHWNDTTQSVHSSQHYHCECGWALWYYTAVKWYRMASVSRQNVRTRLSGYLLYPFHRKRGGKKRRIIVKSVRCKSAEGCMAKTYYTNDNISTFSMAISFGFIFPVFHSIPISIEWSKCKVWLRQRLRSI